MADYKMLLTVYALVALAVAIASTALSDKLRKQSSTKDTKALLGLSIAQIVLAVLIGVAALAEPKMSSLRQYLAA